MDIRRRLPQTNPTAYQQDLADTLSTLAYFHFTNDNRQQAAKEVEEATGINRQRWKANPEIAGDDLAKDLILESILQQEPAAKCQLAREAAAVAQTALIKTTASQNLEGCPAQ